MEQLSGDRQSRSGTSRRTFIQLASLGGASLLIGTRWAEAGVAATTDALLLTCMDYRVMDDAEHYMAGRGLRNKYDHIVLAGSSLGAITEKYPAWKQTFWEHLEIAIKLHDIRSVLLLDHRDCGAYRLILGADKVADAKIEKETHAVQLKELKSQINKKHPKLAVEMLLMALDGKVEVIAG